MNIQCPKCQKSYNVNITSEEIPEKGRKFSCQNCKNQFFVRKKQESSFISLMENIKEKLDDWDNGTKGERVNEAETDAHDENRQKSEEDSSEVVDEELDDFLQEILDEEESEENSLSMPEHLPSSDTDIELENEDLDDEELDKIFEEVEHLKVEDTLKELEEEAVAEELPIEEPPVPDLLATPEPELEAEPVVSGQEDIDKMLEEALSGQLGETVHEPIEGFPLEESVAEPEAEAALEAVVSGQEDIDRMLEEALSGQASEAKPEEPSTEKSESVESGQEDIDALFAEAVSQQLNGTLQNSPEATAKKKSPAPSEDSASEPEAAGQGDIDRLFEEAVSQQMDGTLKDSETSTKSQPSSDESQSDIDSLWASALEEASGTQKSDSADSDKAKVDEAYTVDGDQFQSDLESLLESANESTGVSKGKADKKTKIEAGTQTLDVSEFAVSDDKTLAESHEETTAMEMPVSDEDDSFTEEGTEEDSETDIETISESEQEPLKEKILFYKDMVVFFLTDKKKVVKFVIPAFIALSLMSGGGYWYFSKQVDSKIMVATVDKKETAQMDKKTEAIEPAPVKETQKAEEATIPKPVSTKEGKPDDQIKVAKKEETQEVETKQQVIPGAAIPSSKGITKSISIGSIVPIVFNQDETRVLSLNIKLDIDDLRVYEQIKKGLPVFEDKVESAIEQYFEGKFYKDIQFVQKKLGEELHSKLNGEVKGGKIKTLELEDFIVQ